MISIVGGLYQRTYRELHSTASPTASDGDYDSAEILAAQEHFGFARPTAIEKADSISLIGGSANRNSIPQLTEIDHCVEITFLQDAVIDAVDVDEDRSEGVVARFRNAADLAIDLRDHGTL